MTRSATSRLLSDSCSTPRVPSQEEDGVLVPPTHIAAAWNVRTRLARRATPELYRKINRLRSGWAGLARWGLLGEPPRV